VEERALRILGVGATSVEAMLKPTDDSHCIAALAVAGQTLAADRELGVMLAYMVLRDQIEVILWGDAPFIGLHKLHVESVCYRISSAARAFKAQALKALGLSDLSAGPAENFRQLSWPDSLVVSLKNNRAASG
jgi:hypothetical protein